MAKKPTPLKTYSFRLDHGAVETLRQRARERGLPVAMVVRSIVANFLSERDADDYLAATEEKILATINRLNRTQLQTRRVADISVAQGEYLRRRIDLLCIQRAPGDDLRKILAEQRDTFMTWLPKALTSTGVVRQMIRQVMNEQNTEPRHPEQADDAHYEENAND